MPEMDWIPSAASARKFALPDLRSWGITTDGLQTAPAKGYCSAITITTSTSTRSATQHRRPNYINSGYESKKHDGGQLALIPLGLRHLRRKAPTQFAGCISVTCKGPSQ